MAATAAAEPFRWTKGFSLLQMRYLRTSGLRPLDALRPIATAIDSCWWYIGGQGFSMTREFIASLRDVRFSENELHDYWMQLLTDYVDHDSPVGRVGKPGLLHAVGQLA